MAHDLVKTTLQQLRTYWVAAPAIPYAPASKPVFSFSVGSAPTWAAPAAAAGVSRPPPQLNYGINPDGSEGFVPPRSLPAPGGGAGIAWAPAAAAPPQVVSTQVLPAVEAQAYQPAKMLQGVEISTSENMGWNAGAQSARCVPGGVRVQFRLDGWYAVAAGLAFEPAEQPVGGKTIAHGLLLENSYLYLYKHGNKTDPGTPLCACSKADVLAIERRDGVVKYYRNDELLLEEPAESNGLAWLEAALYGAKDAVLDPAIEPLGTVGRMDFALPPLRFRAANKAYASFEARLVPIRYYTKNAGAWLQALHGFLSSAEANLSIADGVFAEGVQARVDAALQTLGLPMTAGAEDVGALRLLADAAYQTGRLGWGFTSRDALPSSAGVLGRFEAALPHGLEMAASNRPRATMHLRLPTVQAAGTTEMMALVALQRILSKIPPGPAEIPDDALQQLNDSLQVLGLPALGKGDAAALPGLLQTAARAASQGWGDAGIKPAYATLDIRLPGLIARMAGQQGTVGRMELALPPARMAAANKNYAEMRLALPKAVLVADAYVGPGRAVIGSGAYALQRWVLRAFVVVHITSGGKISSAYTSSISLQARMLERARCGDTWAVSALVQAAMRSHAVAREKSVGVDEPVQEVWVMNLDTAATSTYSAGYAFNSFAQIGGRYYGADDTGIHMLEGASDAGQPIAATVGFGRLDWGSALRKTLSGCYVGMAGDGHLYLKVACEGQQYIYRTRSFSPHMQQQRVTPGKGLRSNYVDLELVNDNGSDFCLDEVEFHLAESTTRRI